MNLMLNNLKKGFSLIETLVAVALFAVLATISTQALGTSLRNARKSQSLGEVRENVDYSISTLERLLRNALDFNCTASTPQKLVYTDEYNRPTQIECIGDYIASGSGALAVRITSEDVSVTNCGSMFTCTEDPLEVIPDSVNIVVSAEDSDFAGTEEGAVITSQTKINLRVYK